MPHPRRPRQLTRRTKEQVIDGAGDEKTLEEVSEGLLLVLWLWPLWAVWPLWALALAPCLPSIRDRSYSTNFTVSAAGQIFFMIRGHDGRVRAKDPRLEGGVPADDCPEVKLRTLVRPCDIDQLPG
jgi:hypothetical protein